MESTKYISKVGLTVPLYDSKTDSYLVINEDSEEVNIPKDLFHKLFRVYTEEEQLELAAAKKQIEEYTKNKTKKEKKMDFLKNMFESEGKNFEETAKLMRSIGIPKEFFIENTVKIAKEHDYNASDEDLRKEAEEIYEYIMEEPE
jgi:hypothetical protein